MQRDRSRSARRCFGISGSSPAIKSLSISSRTAVPSCGQLRPRHRSTGSSAISATLDRSLSRPGKLPRCRARVGRRQLRITADTNVLVRAAVDDDPDQARLAAETLRGAEIIAVTLPTLCEFVWVLVRGYAVEGRSIAAAIRRLVDSANVRVDRPAVDAGLAVFEAGGDFADGVIAFEGSRLGGSVFTSFDRRAVEPVATTGAETRLLAAD